MWAEHHRARHERDPDPPPMRHVTDALRVCPWYELWVMRALHRIVCGHCWHRAPADSGLRSRGRWYCCECPATRDTDPVGFLTDPACEMCEGLTRSELESDQV